MESHKLITVQLNQVGKVIIHLSDPMKRKTNISFTPQKSGVNGRSYSNKPDDVFRQSGGLPARANAPWLFVGDKERFTTQ